jgi:hypothetical protein
MVRVSVKKQRHSAYRSMRIAKEGKMKSPNGGLRRWIQEDWRNLTPYAFGVTTLQGTPECGDGHQNPVVRGVRQKSVCRPMRRVSRRTPVLAKNYSRSQVRKAVTKKNRGERVVWAEL